MLNMFMSSFFFSLRTRPLHAVGVEKKVKVGRRWANGVAEPTLQFCAHTLGFSFTLVAFTLRGHFAESLFLVLALGFQPKAAKERMKGGKEKEGQEQKGSSRVETSGKKRTGEVGAIEQQVGRSPHVPSSRLVSSRLPPTHTPTSNTQKG